MCSIIVDQDSDLTRGIKTNFFFFQITTKGIDFYIGVPKEIFYRVARIAPPPFYSLEVLMDPSIWSFFWNWHSGFNSLFVKSFSFAEVSNIKLSNALLILFRQDIPRCTQL